MNDLFEDTKAIVIFLLGAIMTLLSWIGRQHLREFSEFKKNSASEIHDLKENSVTREELAKTLTQMREDRFQMHRENREELRYIRQRVDGIADRQ